MMVFPENNFVKDKLTPYRCTLLVLIKEYALLCDGKNKNYPRMVWQDEWSSKRHLDRNLLTWIQQPDGSLKDILRIVSSCSKVLYSEFTSVLDSIVNCGSIGNLEDFFINLVYALFEEKNSLLNKRGLLGLFCRRMLVYYERLSFCKIQPFFESFIKYCSPYIAIKKPLSEAIGKSVDNIAEPCDSFAPQHSNKDILDDMELESQSEMDSKSSHDSNDADLKSCDLKAEKCEEFEVSESLAYQQAEFFFSQQAAMIELKESDALSPTTLQCKIRQVLKDNPDLTQAHYVSYLNNLRLREFCGSIDSLFMCFVRRNNQPASFDTNQNRDGENSRTQRFATLNLALLHLRFGHKKAAVAAAKESVRLSQISNDPLCLQHGMSLLNHLEPNASSKKITNEVINPGKKQNLTDLAFLAVQAHMSHLSHIGKKPAHIFRNLAAADALQCTRPCSYFASTTFAHKASLWKMYGKRRMAILHCQLVLGMQSTLDKKSFTSPTHFNSEDIALCLSHLIELLSEEGMTNSASDLLHHAKTRFPANFRHSQFWRKVETRLNHRASLRLCKQIDAKQNQQSCLVLDEAEAKFSEAENLASRGELLESHNLLRLTLQANMKKELNQEIKSKIYLLMGDILSRNKSGHSASFKYFLEALAIAHRSFLHGLVNKALLKIAQLQLHSNSPQIALSCLKSFKNENSSNGDLHERSRMLFVAVRCYLRLKKVYGLADIDNFIEWLMICRGGFEKLQDLARQRDVDYLLAKLYNEKSKLLEAQKQVLSKACFEALHHRNEYAAEFKRIDMQIGSLGYTAVI